MESVLFENSGPVYSPNETSMSMINVSEAVKYTSYFPIGRFLVSFLKKLEKKDGFLISK
jgi:hypothetical protein